MKRWIFEKNALTLFESGRKKNAHFRAHYLFLAKNAFWTKNRHNQEKTIKILISAEIAQNLKWHLFFEKGVFRDGWELGFTNCVFEKRSSQNTIFIVFSAKHSSCNKNYMLRKAEHLEKIVACLNMAKWWFGGLFFEVLMVLWFVFVCLV